MAETKARREDNVSSLMSAVFTTFMFEGRGEEEEGGRKLKEKESNGCKKLKKEKNRTYKKKQKEKRED